MADNTQDRPISNSMRIDMVEHRINTMEVALTNQLTALNGQVNHLIGLAEKYVTQDRFKPVQLIVYGLVALMLTSVIGALLARVIVK